MATTDMRMVRWAMGGELVRTSEKLGDIGRSKGGMDSDGYEKEGWNGSGTSKEEMKLKTSKQL